MSFNLYPQIFICIYVQVNINIPVSHIQLVNNKQNIKTIFKDLLMLLSPSIPYIEVKHDLTVLITNDLQWPSSNEQRLAINFKEN